MTIPELEESIQRWGEELARRRWEKERLEEELATLEKRAEEEEERVRLLERVGLLLRETARYAREQNQRQVERIVTSALSSVFGEDFSFTIELSERGGQPAASFFVPAQVGGETVRLSPQESRGGGVVDVVALALRLALLEAVRPPREGPLLLDEPCKHVSREYLPHVARFLREMSRRFGRQIIMVTHAQELEDAADAVFRVEKSGDESRVFRLFPR